MSSYIARRVAGMVAVLVFISFFAFSLIHMLPGDPATAMLMESAALSKKAVEEMRERLGLNDPFLVQYGRFLSRAIRGDFGRSIQTNRPVMQSILEVLPNTVQLAAGAIVIAGIIGLPLGIVAGLFRGTIVDNVSMLVALLGISMPIFWVGLLLILLFSVKLRLLPVLSPKGFQGLILPAIAVGWGSAGLVARLVRASMLEVVRQEFVTTARAKGLAERTVILRHVLRNMLNPVITVFGLQFGSLLGGAMITETVFARQGLGRLVVNAILKKDFPIVQGSVVFIAIGIMVVNLVVDVLCAILDPRIRYD